MFRQINVISLGLLFLVAACGSTTADLTTTPTPATSGSSASGSPTPQASATPVSYDPCVLVNEQDASSLAGINFPAGRKELANGTKYCIYGYQTKDVFDVGIAQAKDLATAHAYEAQAKAALVKSAAHGLPFTEVQGIGDAAAVVQASESLNGTTFALCGIYVLKGTIFFFISVIAVNHAVPSNAALEGQAAKVLGQI